LPVAAHIAESDVEQQMVERGEGTFADGHRRRGIPVAPRARSSIALLERNGVLKTRPLLIHCVRLDADDIQTIRASQSPVAHCPVSNAKLGHGTSPLLELLAAGVRIGLGSDSVASNNRMDLLAEGRAAILAQRARAGRHDALCARDALFLATLSGARALGMDADVGSLEPGKSADLAAFPVDVHALPVHDPEAAAIFALPGVPARLVTVAGRELVRDGSLASADPALGSRVAATAAKMREWAAGEARS
jgi:cytosine/adenosine deaminase-related metal-dependent hydrolase